MHMPPEIGKHIYSFLKPSKSLFWSLKEKYPQYYAKLQFLCEDHLHAQFINYYMSYHSYKKGDQVCIKGYKLIYTIQHITLPDHILEYFIESPHSYIYKCIQFDIRYNVSVEETEEYKKYLDTLA